ncbi:MAG: S-layer homology domain-containing protein [Defluviitaleaceae bacterium]|nr:S-layer homology domain-containing protein [Defluviitaleaceae bacterium]
MKYRKIYLKAIAIALSFTLSFGAAPLVAQDEPLPLNNGEVEEIETIETIETTETTEVEENNGLEEEPGEAEENGIEQTPGEDEEEGEENGSEEDLEEEEAEENEIEEEQEEDEEENEELDPELGDELDIELNGEDILFAYPAPVLGPILETEMASAAALVVVNQINGADVGLVATAFGDTVYVDGYGASDATLSLYIDYGITVVWRAFYSAEIDGGSLLALDGNGTFELADQWIRNIGAGNAINSENVTVNVTGGTVLAESGTAIQVKGRTATVTVSSGSVMTNSTTNLHPAIALTSNLNNDLNVTITGGSVATVSDMGNSFAVQTYGSVEISGNARVFANAGRAVSTLGNNTGIYISGGEVWSETGMAIHAGGANTTIVISGGLVYNEGTNDDHAVIDISGASASGSVTISGNGVVEAMARGTAVRAAGNVYVQDNAVVSATYGRAIHTTGAGAVNISGGFVFAWGNTPTSALSGTVGNVIDSANFSGETGNGVVAAWATSVGVGEYGEMTIEALNTWPAHSGFWHRDGSRAGIAFENGPNVGFFPIRGVTIVFDESNYGLIFSSTDGVFWLDIDGSGTISAHDVRYTGQSSSWNWSSINRTLAFNSFSWATPAETALTILGGDITISLAGENNFASTSTQAGTGVFTEYAITTVGAGSLTAQALERGIVASEITVVGGMIEAGGDIQAIAASVTPPQAHTYITNEINANPGGVGIVYDHYSSTDSFQNSEQFRFVRLQTDPTGRLLVSVADYDTSALNNTGTAIAPVHAAINVANSMATLSLADIRYNGAFVNLYNASGSEITGIDTIELAEGEETVAIIRITDGDGVEAYYAISIFRAEGIRFMVTFDPMGGLVEPVTMFAQSQTATLAYLPDPIRSNYVFVGWFTQEEGGDEVTVDTIFTSNVKVYAHWVTAAAVDGNNEAPIPPQPTVNGNGQVVPQPPTNGNVVPVPPQLPTFDTNARIPHYFNNITASGDIEISFAPGSFELLHLQMGDYILQEGIDYIATENRVILTSNFILRQTEPEMQITFVMSGGANPHVVIIVPYVVLLIEYPLLTTTRGAVVTILYRMAGSPDTSGLTIPFYDVYDSVYYSNAVRWGAYHNIILGYGDDTYGPSNNITREQLAAMLMRYVSFMGIPLPVIEAEGHQVFSDMGNVSHYAAYGVTRLAQAGIVFGRPDGTFGPQAQVTNEDLVYWLENLLLLE